LGRFVRGACFKLDYGILGQTNLIGFLGVALGFSKPRRRLTTKKDTMAAMLPLLLWRSAQPSASRRAHG
jgi:hypothetical protein